MYSEADLKKREREQTLKKYKLLKTNNLHPHRSIKTRHVV